MITSILDTDLYKLTMMQLVLHRFPTVPVEYQFHCRTPNIDLTPYAQIIRQQVDQLADLCLQPEELAYLKTLNIFTADYLEYLAQFRFDPSQVEIDSKEGFNLLIRGLWLNTILYEVPILAIISRVHSNAVTPEPDFTLGENKLTVKIQTVRAKTPEGKFKFVEFGTRRRFSFAWQKRVLEILKNNLPNNLDGTSNVYFAKELNLKPVGTMAHEYIQAFQALTPNLRESQRLAFQTWLQEYDGKSSVALADTYGIKVFLADFDRHFCEAFRGVRQDSGDPFLWGEKLLAHYEKLGIDAKSKTIVFSDALTFDLAIELFWCFKERTNPAFGIGTHLTNDLSHKPIQIVIKMTECNGKPVAKLSDSPAKTMCRDPVYLAHLRQVFNIR